ncbi:FMN-binding negative transcriptional regulator [Trueperella sp. LYQ141]|uniref:FMN-binding negative transcriptional regulator n=1 Tax=Trueperella sp. LYQ141 TaxID=3391058 RepID=UPI003983D4F4
MYVAQQHQLDEERAWQLVCQLGVGQFVSLASGQFDASLLPFNVVRDGERAMLQAHVNRVNPQWRSPGAAMVIVTGPQAHIAGTDLPAEKPEAKMPVVPTWNYITVHLHGHFTIHDDPAWKREHLARLVATHEDTWRPETHSNYQRINNALNALVGIEFEVEKIAGKAKLGQNMAAMEIRDTAQRLRARDPLAAPVADAMEEIAVPWALAREARVENARQAGRSTLPIALPDVEF